MVPSVNTVLQNYIWKGEHERLAELLYDSPPVTLDGFAARASNIRNQYTKTLWHVGERMDLLEKILIASNKKIGSLTPQVEESIRALKHGAIESAHQTVVLGGPAYVLNKPITAKIIAQLCAENDTKFQGGFI